MTLKLVFTLLSIFLLGQASPINKSSPTSNKDDGQAIKIIGGTNATAGELPWMVSIQYNTFGTLRHICGGSLINATHVLTAAHCINGINLANVVAVAGAVRLFANQSSQQSRVPFEYSVHGDFQHGQRIRNDIGILEVNPFILNRFVAGLPLPPQDHLARGSCIMAGWGQTSSGSSSDFLLKVTLPIVNDTRCLQHYGDELDPGTQICAGYETEGYDFCTGDTGGPLACNDTGEYYIGGIASWGYSCGQSQPGVYTEVSKYTSGLAPPVSIRFD